MVMSRYLIVARSNNRTLTVVMLALITVILSWATSRESANITWIKWDIRVLSVVAESTKQSKMAAWFRVIKMKTGWIVFQNRAVKLVCFSQMVLEPMQLWDLLWVKTSISLNLIIVKVDWSTIMAIQTQAQYLHRLSEIIDSNKTVVKLVVLQPKVIIKIITVESKTGKSVR